MVRIDMYKLVVLDVDGTLLAPDGTVQPRVYDTVHTTRLAGCKITLATGRFLNGTRGLIESLNITTPLILHVGSLIQDPVTEAILYEDLLSPGSVKAAIYTITTFGYQPIINDVGGRRLTGPPELDPSPEIKLFLETRQINRVSISDLCKIEHVLGISVFSPDDDLESFQGILQDKTNSRVLIYRPGPGHPLPWYQLEIFPLECSKGRALRFLIELLGIGREEVLAIGDNINDIEMLREAGMGVAMGNAPDAVKSVANAVVGTNEQDGVAEALEKYVLSGRTIAL